MASAQDKDGVAGPEGLDGVRHVVAVGSGKGGVGKSTVAVNLAVALAQEGSSVGLLDADIYGPSQPGLLGASGEEATAAGEVMRPSERHGVRFMSVGLLMPQGGPVVWRAPMAVKLLQQFLFEVAWGRLDFLLIDMPPGTGDVQLTLAQAASLSGAVIVTTPQRVALDVARKGLQMFRQVNVPIVGVVENMSGFTCGHCGKPTAVFKGGGGGALAATEKVPFLGALPLDPEVMAGGDEGLPALVKSPDSGPARAYRALAGEFRRQLGLVQAASGDAPKKLERGPGGEIRVEWTDGHAGRHTPYHLRVNCPCAACVDEHSGKRVLDPKTVPLDVKVDGVQPVGRYGAAFHFSDGHNTGIYTFKNLRTLCECPACRPAAGAFKV
jgi:ATP-binding protein involved in chromosome partitioning